MKRALVLHGGGSAGNAWEIGVIAGLLRGGVDVRRAHLIVGTSAGATAAAQITAASPSELLADILEPATHPQGRPQSFDSGRPPARPPINHLERTNRIIGESSDAEDMRRRIGAAALELDAGTDGSEQTAWRSITAARLPRDSWPEQRLLITAVDARTGRPVVFDRNSGVDLTDAVAASTSSGLPYRIGAERYIDGGYRRNENADLASGFDRVLVLSPFGGRSRHPSEWRMQLDAQLEELRASGSRVETILPDAESLTAFGDNMMNPATRPPAARAGYNQAVAAAADLSEFWG